MWVVLVTSISYFSPSLDNVKHISKALSHDIY